MADEKLKIAGLRLKIDGAAEFNKSITSVNNELKLASANLAKVTAEFDKNTPAVERLAAKQQDYANKLEAARKKGEEYQRVLASVKAQYGENSEEVMRAETLVARNEAEQIKLQKALQDVSHELEIQQSQWTQYGAKAEAAGAKISNVGEKITSVGKTLTLSVTAPIATFATAATKASIEFESAFAGVRKTVEATEEQFAEMEQEIRDMSKRIPATTTEISSVAEAAGQLGIATEDITSFTEVMIAMGVATNLTADEAATSLAQFANITGMAAEDYSRLGAAIVDLGNNFATTEADIVEMSTRLAAGGTLAGLTETEILALATAMSSVGIEAEAGGTAMTQTLTAIEQSVASADAKLQMFADVAGMTAEEFAVAWENKPAEALTAFIDGLGRLDEKGENATLILEEMGLSGIRQSNMLKSLALASDQLTGAIELSNDAWNENTALTNEAEQRYDTLESKIQITKNHLNDAAITLGNTLMPYIEKRAQKISELAEAFSNLDENQRENILRWAGIAAAIGPVTLVIGKVTGTVGKVVTSFGNLSRAIGNAGGLLSYIGGHPIKTAVTAFAGIVTVTGLVGTALDNLDLPINNLRNSIDDNAKTVKSLSEEFDNLIAKQGEVIESGLSETEYLESLKLELDGIVDSNGKIQESYEKRAQFIIGKLSEATGVEITAVDGVIQKYDDLTVAIDDAIAKKRAMIILEGKEEAYTTAIQNLSEYEQAYIDAYHNMQLAQEEYDKYGGIVYAKQLEKAKKTVAEMSETLNGAHEIIRDFETTKAEVEAGNFESVAEMYGYVAATQEKITALTVDETKKQLEATKTALEEQVLLYKDTGQEKYQLSAEQAAQELALLVSHLQAMGIEVDQGTLEMLKEWQEYFAQQATNQENANNESINEQEKYMDEFDDAIESGGKDAVSTMSTAVQNIYNAAAGKMSLFSTIGSNIVSGIIEGVQSGQSFLNAAISTAINAGVAAGKKAADSHSPSKKAARELGAPISQGIAVGIASETPLIEKSLRNSMIETFSAAKSWTVNVQTDLNSRLRDFTSALSTGSQNSVTTNNAYNYEYGGITVQNMIVREENDIKRIAKELFAMQRAANRGQGVVMP